jgi:S-adenosylmethionine uptake transporter
MGLIEEIPPHAIEHNHHDASHRSTSPSTAGFNRAPCACSTRPCSNPRRDIRASHARDRETAIGTAQGRPYLAPSMPAPPAPPILARLVLLAIAAEGLLTLMDALIKQLSPRYPTLEIAFLRYAFGMLGAVVYALWMRPGWPTREAAAYNGLRALLIVVTATSFFFALGRLPLADAIAMSFISPALTALLGAMLLGERLDWRIGLALTAGFLGMLLIVGGKLGAAGIGEEVLIGAAAVLVSAVGYSLNLIMLRHRATRDPLAQIILFQNLGPALILALPAFWVWKRRRSPILACSRCSAPSGSSRIPCWRMPSPASRPPGWRRSPTSRWCGVWYSASCSSPRFRGSPPLSARP